MKYSTNPIIRETIMQEARKLFYDKGYEKTTVDDIATACGISKGLISYHFKAKIDLAYEIFESDRYEFIQIVNRKIAHSFGKTSVASMSGIFDRLLLRQMKQDSKVYSFFRAMVSNAKNIQANDYSFHLHQIYVPSYSEGKSDDNFTQLTSAASRGAAGAVIISYFDKEIDPLPTYEEFEDYRVSIYYRLMNYSTEEIRQLQEESRLVADQIELEYLPYFKIR
ncbi:MAG: TetR/AcrR family transcriptional regulator [Lachnospiraceae bacterium]|nr:TetR/AcrR family transcriptional regulator [Lachnospiraceae bacterium]